MFFLKDLNHEMLLHPKFFGPDMKVQLRKKLFEDVEGKYDRRFGIIVAVKDVISIGKGKIVEGKGIASFKVKYRALVFRLFKNEAIDAVVTQVSRVGIFAMAGPIMVIVHSSHIPSEFHFDSTTITPCFQSENETIAKDSEIRIRLISWKVEESDVVAVGTIKEDYLGLV